MEKEKKVVEKEFGPRCWNVALLICCSHLRGAFVGGILNTDNFCKELFHSLIDISARASSVEHENDKLLYSLPSFFWCQTQRMLVMVLAKHQCALAMNFRYSMHSFFHDQQMQTPLSAWNIIGRASRS